jgi:hypothetical protein
MRDGKLFINFLTKMFLKINKNAGVFPELSGMKK